MKTIILIAPSEGKQTGGQQSSSSRTFFNHTPTNIASQATPKELKCKAERYAEAIKLNQNIEKGPRLPAIQRYGGVQYQALDYQSLKKQAQQYINENALILSAMYGLLKPQDMIANYKLPISTVTKNYRKAYITKAIQNIAPHTIINLLPGSYAAMIDRKQIDTKIITPEFYQLIHNKKKKLTHMVKKYRGYRLREYAKNHQNSMIKKIASDNSIHIEYKQEH